MKKIFGYIRTILSNGYYKINIYFEKINGFDFSSKERIDNLQLDKDKSEQYESTKKFELKNWLTKIPVNNYVGNFI